MSKSNVATPMPPVKSVPPLTTAGRSLVQRIRGFGGALGALLVLVTYLSVTQPFFLTPANILNVLGSNSALAICAVGLTFILLSAGFDLSIGAIFASAGYVVWATLNAGLSPVLAIIFGMLIGAVLGGAVNGVLIGKLRLNFLVVTLGTMSLFGGILNVITNGKTNTVPIPPGGLMAFLGNGRVLGIPFPVILAVAAILLAGYVLKFTTFGRAVYAVGGNRDAARLAGINVDAVYVAVYSTSGLLVGLAGVLDAARLASASPTAGGSLALTAAAAVLLGGTSLMGGSGGVSGTVVGVLLIAFLQNGLGLMGVSSWWQGVVTGTVLILAILLDRFQFRGRNRKQVSSNP